MTISPSTYSLKGKKIAVFGMGTSGVSAFKLAHHLGAEAYAVSKGEVSTWNCLNSLENIVDRNRLFDQEDSSVSQLFASMDQIILSPGIPREHNLLKEALAKNVELICEIELAYRCIESDKTPIMGLTGTNGKTTTVSLLGEIFKKAGHKTFVGGNIGIAFCDYALNRLQNNDVADAIILELSSFQLESLVSFRPNVAAILNIYPNHGERYEKVEDYSLAKWNIINQMKKDKDVLFVSKNTLEAAHRDTFSMNIIDEDDLNFFNIDTKTFKLIGKHNLINLSFALSMAKEFETQFGLKLNNLESTITDFSGVAHRLQYLKSNDTFTIYNDAKSTNWDATITALKSFDDVEVKKDVYLILGGQKRGRGDSIKPFASDILPRIKKAFLIGETTEDLASELDELNVSYEKSVTIENAFRFVREEGFCGYLVFSPAFPSFDQFQNYVKRGEAFTALAANK